MNNLLCKLIVNTNLYILNNIVNIYLYDYCKHLRDIDFVHF